MPVALNLTLFNTSSFPSSGFLLREKSVPWNVWHSLRNPLLTLKNYSLIMKRSCTTLWITFLPFRLIYLLFYLWARAFPGCEPWEHIFSNRDGMQVPNIQSLKMSARYPNATCALQSINDIFLFWAPKMLMALHVWCVIFILKVYSGEMFCTVF